MFTTKDGERESVVEAQERQNGDRRRAAAWSEPWSPRALLSQGPALPRLQGRRPVPLKSSLALPRSASHRACS